MICDGPNHVKRCESPPGPCPVGTPRGWSLWLPAGICGLVPHTTRQMGRHVLLWNPCRGASLSSAMFLSRAGDAGKGRPPSCLQIRDLVRRAQTLALRLATLSEQLQRMAGAGLRALPCAGGTRGVPKQLNTYPNGPRRKYLRKNRQDHLKTLWKPAFRKIPGMWRLASGASAAQTPQAGAPPSFQRKHRSEASPLIVYVRRSPCGRGRRGRSSAKAGEGEGEGEGEGLLKLAPRRCGLGLEGWAGLRPPGPRDNDK